jgi:hypothetical protein
VVQNLTNIARVAHYKEVAACLKRHSRGPISEAVVAFHDAAFGGNIEAVQGFLRDGGNPDAPDEVGTTAACLAANRNRVIILELLRNAGADLAIVDDRDWFPLRFAAMAGHEEAYDYLWKFTPAKYQNEAEEVKAERIREGMWHGKS